MFTPPPSPQPPRRYPSPAADSISITTPPSEKALLPQPHLSPLPSHPDPRRRIARRIGCTVLLLPCILILITLSTHYITHPAVLDIFSSPNASWHNSPSDWTMHRRHPSSPTTASIAGSQSVLGLASMTSATATVAQTTNLPTVPAQAPALPTPFPQAYDSVLSTNFSTSCSAFFVNMTNVVQFRECRPFSFLLQTSEIFINAQSNLTEMNTLIYGTCNTDVDEDTCVTNMNVFAQQLKSACATDLSQNNVLVVSALQSLQAYKVMRDASCLEDQSANTYCFMDAIFNTNPSDLYFYDLPLGEALPNSTTPTCSACTKSIMAMYAEALDDQFGNVGSSSSESDNTAPLAGLLQTYGTSAALTQQKCGSSYAQTVAASTSSSGAGRAVSLISLWILVATVLGASSLSGLQST